MKGDHNKSTGVSGIPSLLNMSQEQVLKAPGEKSQVNAVLPSRQVAAPSLRRSLAFTEQRSLEAGGVMGALADHGA